MGVWYCSREEVKSALNSAETARNNLQVDRAIEAASRDVESLCHRKFYPLIATRYFDWPNLSWSRPWRLWLDDNELISVTSLTSGGVVIPSTDYFLEPQNDGPPYDSIEIDLSSSSSFTSGSTFQRSVAVAGVFGYRDDSFSAGSLAASINGSAVELSVDDGSAFGVGDLIKVDDERMTVVARGNRTSGQTILASLSNLMNGTSVSVTNGAAFHPDEIIIVDSEKMRVVDVVGNSLIVIRAVDGSTLAAHTNGATIYVVGWSVTVARGALGTTAASHSNGATITKWIAPTPVHQLTIAMALDSVEQEKSGYSRVIGSKGESGGSTVRDASGAAIANLRERVYQSHGRKARKYAV